MFGKPRQAPLLLLLAVSATITDLLVAAAAEPTNQTRTLSIPEKPSLPYWRRSSNISTSAPNNTTTTNRTNFPTFGVNSTVSTRYKGSDTNSSHTHPCCSNSSIIQLNGTSSLNISRTNSSNQGGNSSSPSVTYQGRFNSSPIIATSSLLGNQSNSSSFFVNCTEPVDTMILPAVVEPTPASTYIVWIVVALSVLVIIILLIIVIILCRRRQNCLEDRQSTKVPVIIADDVSTQAVRSTAKHLSVVDACSSSAASSTIIFEVDILDEDPKDPMTTAA